MAEEKMVRNDEYENVESFFDLVLRAGPHRVNAEERSKYFDPANTGKGEDWLTTLGTAIGNLEQYRGFVRGGWAKGAKTMRETAGSLAFPKAKSVRRKTAFGDEGTEVDIDRMMRGEVDVMWRTTRRESGGGAKRHIKVVVNCSGAASHDGEEFFWRGAVGCVIADALEGAGYRVELDVYHYGSAVYEPHKRDTPDHFLSICLKQYDEALDFNRMAALTGHAAILRVATFAHMTLGDKKLASNLGYPIHTTKQADVRQDVHGLPPEYVEQGDIVIDGIWNRDAAVDFLKQIEARFN